MQMNEIKYFKVKCHDCGTEYTINLELEERQPLFCYKCSIPLHNQNLDRDRIDDANSALKRLSEKYEIEPDGDGLVISKIIPRNYNVNQ